MKPVRRKWGTDERTTRWQVVAKIGTHPLARVYLERRPTVGAILRCWTGDRGQSVDVVIDRLLSDVVFCHLR